MLSNISVLDILDVKVKLRQCKVLAFGNFRFKGNTEEENYLHYNERVLNDCLASDFFSTD